VSARIQTLERQMGVLLLQRQRNGTTPTAAGQRFLRHAKSLVRTMEQARHDVGLPAGYSGSITLRGRIALWEGFLPKWVAWMREQMPETSLRLEIGFEEDIMQGLIESTIDIGLMYTPENRPGLGIERIFDETLVLVSTACNGEWNSQNYVHIDWGAEFEAQFATRFPDAEPPALLANIGWLGLQQILHSGGAGFFPRRLVAPHIETGRLWQIPDVPPFSLPAYLVYPQDHRDKSMQDALQGLRLLAAQER